MTPDTASKQTSDHLKESRKLFLRSFLAYVSIKKKASLHGKSSKPKNKGKKENENSTATTKKAKLQ